MTLLDGQVSSPDEAPAEVDTHAGPAASPHSSPFPPPPPPVLDASPVRRRGNVVGTAVLCAALSAGVAYGTVQLTQDDSSSVSIVQSGAGGSVATGSSGYDIYALLEKVEPAVAAVELGSGNGDTVTPVAAGSGVVISSDGLMVTNAHVVEAVDGAGNAIDNPVITVKMFDGTVRSAKVLGSSPDYDVALLQLDDTSNLTPLPLADASTFRVGDEVVAIGNALDLGDMPTVTRGIISALDRTLATTNTTTLRGLIQTDAAINHGNSGGALVNANGELVGINSAGIPDAQNIGFAISVGTIEPLLADLKAGKEVSAAPIGYIGVTLSETPAGITVETVQPNTPASGAGIEPGDVIRTVNGTDVSTAEQLSVVLRGLAPGTKVDIVVERGGSEQTITLTLAERPTDG
ncbi:MAG: trypsin-like peptidase domain-containing protein [Actinobacteria bacterium]|nr:trypsin-like peptidase domain-containing protein [Actinomycetota bacterium]